MKREHVKTGLAACVFGAYSVLIVIQQCNSDNRVIRALDPMGMWIPVWRFFGPRPGTSDHNLFVRDRLQDGSTTPWRLLPNHVRRRWHHAFLVANRRRSKALFDAAEQLKLRIQKPNAAGSLHTDPSYLLLAHKAITELPVPREATHRQFMIMSTAGYESALERPTPLFVSHFHLIRFPLDDMSMRIEIKTLVVRRCSRGPWSRGWSRT